MNRSRKWKIALGLGALFLSGVITGALLMHQAGRKFMQHALRPEVMAEHWQRELVHKLQLTPEQSQKIYPPIQAAVTGLRQTLYDQMLTGLTNCNAHIAAELTAEQRAGLLEFEREQKNFIETKFKPVPDATTP